MSWGQLAGIIVTLAFAVWFICDHYRYSHRPVHDARRECALLSQRLERARRTMRRCMREAGCYVEAEVHNEIFDEEAVALADGAWSILDRRSATEKAGGNDE